MDRTRIRLPSAFLLTLLLLSACGGGGGSADPPPVTTTPPTTTPPATNPPPVTPPPVTPAATPRTGTPPPAQPGQFIVFQRGITNIYRYDVDTDTERALWAASGGGIGASAPALSPDGNWVAFSLYDGVQRGDLWVMSAVDGSGIRGVSAPPPEVAGVGDFAWSPDSSKIAYLKLVPIASSEDFYEEVWVVDRDGRNRRKVSEPVPDPYTADMITEIKWSPDSRRVAWKSTDNEELGSSANALDVHDTQAGGSNRVRITGPVVGPSTPSMGRYEWAPDGSRIAYIATTSQGSQVFTVNPDGTDPIQVSQPASPGDDIWLFEWSPDGSHLAYVGGTPARLGLAQPTLHLYSVAPDGTGLTQLNAPLNTGTWVEPYVAWSPDGSRIAYSIRGATEIYSVRPNGSDRTRLNPAPDLLDRISLIKWSPDGSKLAYQVGQLYRTREMYVVNADGTAHRNVDGTLTADPIPARLPVTQHFEWSPTNQALLYAAVKGGTATSPVELFTLQTDTNESVKLNDPLLGQTDHRNTVFRWSKDGSRAAYIADEDGDPNGIRDLIVVASNGSTYRKLSAVAEFFWSP